MYDYSAMLACCKLCPRACGVDRLHGQRGFCEETGESVRVARAALHFWEEPCLSGTRGSGAVFFSGCTLRCVYCQNRELSRGETGFPVNEERLIEIWRDLQRKGAHNINLVTPTHFLPQILDAIPRARERGMTLPFVWNCGGYESVEALCLLEGKVTVYLPDFKYWEDPCSRRWSSAPDYAQYARKALREMMRQTGSPVYDDEGMLQRGVIVRHLVLPGCEEQSKAILQYLYEEYGDSILLSIMNQYTPMPDCPLPELQQPVSDAAYQRVVDFAVSLGIENAYIQEGGTVAESFIPAFDGEGVLAQSQR